MAKCREYGFAGWWMWAYQDTPTSKTGLWLDHVCLRGEEREQPGVDEQFLAS